VRALAAVICAAVLPALRHSSLADSVPFCMSRPYLRAVILVRTSPCPRARPLGLCPFRGPGVVWQAQPASALWSSGTAHTAITALSAGVFSDVLDLVSRPPRRTFGACTSTALTLTALLPTRGTQASRRAVSATESSERRLLRRPSLQSWLRARDGR